MSKNVFGIKKVDVHCISIISDFYTIHKPEAHKWKVMP